MPDEVSSWVSPPFSAPPSEALLPKPPFEVSPGLPAPPRSPLKPLPPALLPLPPMAYGDLPPTFVYVLSPAPTSLPAEQAAGSANKLSVTDQFKHVRVMTRPPDNQGPSYAGELHGQRRISFDILARTFPRTP